MAGQTVTRAQLSEAVYQEVGLSRNESAELVETVLNEISDALTRGDMVKISSFGSFAVRKKGKRVGRNPKTGQEVPINPRRVLVFRASHVLKDQINAMVASGNTNQAVGLAWGWQSLSTDNDPIKAPPKDTNYMYQDYVVLLSDGLNTQNRWSSSQTSIDARQKILCQNIKNDKLHPVTVFTIQVNVKSADAESQVLKECITPDGSFQMITSATQTSDAFKNILTQISRLRVAK